MILNFTPPNFQLVIGGTLDVTSAVTSLSLSRNNWRIGSPIYWSGNIELIDLVPPNALAESLDDWVNKTRWARGEAVTLSISGNLFATLRIASYFYNEDEKRATIEVSQLLNLLDYNSLPKDYEGLGFDGDREYTLSEIITALLSEGGISNFDLTGIPNENLIPPNLTNGSPIALASTYLNERRYWLYHDKDETVKIAPYQIDSLSGEIKFNRSRGETEDYLRRQVQRLPPNKIYVNGGGDVFDNCKIDEELITEIGYSNDGGYPYRSYEKTIQIVENTETSIIRDIEIRQAKKDILPNSTDRNRIKTHNTVQRNFFDSEGRLTRFLEETDLIEAVAFPGVNEPTNAPLNESLQTITDGETIDIIYKFTKPNTESDDESVLRYRKKTIKRPYLSGSVESTVEDRGEFLGSINVQVLDSYIVEEFWDPIDSDESCQLFRFSRRVSRRSQLRQVDETSITYKPSALAVSVEFGDDRDNVLPPRWETRPPLNPVKNANLETIVEVTTPGIATVVGSNARRLEYQAKTITTEQQAIVLGEFLGKSSQHDYYSREISLPLADCSEYLADPKPFQRCYIHEGAFLVSQESIAITSPEAELAFIGLFEKSLDLEMPTRQELLDAGATLPILDSIGRTEIGSTIPLPDEEQTFPSIRDCGFTFPLTFICGSEGIGEFDLPTFDNIVIDSNGDISVASNNVVVTAGYEFFEIITDGSDVVIWDDNLVIDITAPFSQEFYDLVLCVDNEPITIDGFLLTIDDL